MSYQDPLRRQRLSRYSALAHYEDSYQPYKDTRAGYSRSAGYPYQSGAGSRDGYAGLAGQGTRGQRPPWEDPAEQTTWDTPAQRDADQRRRASGPFFAASDDDEDDGRRSARRRGVRGRGRLAGSVAGFLAAAVAIGVANLAAAFVRPQASPIIAVGGWFIDHTPSWLKNFAVQKFGENDKNMLLLGMYVTIAIIAIVIGMLAWRRIGIGVAGIGLFGLFGAYIAITRPESRVTDVIPSIVGGIAGIVAIVLLVRVGAAKPVSAAWKERTAGTRRGAAWTGGNS